MFSEPFRHEPGVWEYDPMYLHPRKSKSSAGRLVHALHPHAHVPLATMSREHARLRRAERASPEAIWIQRTDEIRSTGRTHFRKWQRGPRRMQNIGRNIGHVQLDGLQYLIENDEKQ